MSHSTTMCKNQDSKLSFDSLYNISNIDNISNINNTMSKQPMFKLENPDKLSQPWHGASLTLHDKAGFNDYMLKNLGTLKKRGKSIRKFMQLPEVKQLLGDSFIKQFQERDSKL